MRTSYALDDCGMGVRCLENVLQLTTLKKRKLREHLEAILHRYLTVKMKIGNFGRADVVSNGLEVLEALHRQTYDVILMDIRMPEMDGLTTSSRLQQDYPPEHRPKIIAMTADAMQGDREKCLEVGMDDYLAKPFSYIELLARIKSLLRRQQYLQENELSISDLKMDMVGHKVWRSGNLIELSKTEFNLL